MKPTIGARACRMPQGHLSDVDSFLLQASRPDRPIRMPEGYVPGGYSGATATGTRVASRLEVKR